MMDRDCPIKEELKMTDEEKKIMIPLLEKLGEERCSNREKRMGRLY